MSYITVLDALPRLQTLAASDFYIEIFDTIHPNLLSRDERVFPLKELILRVETFFVREHPRWLKEFSDFPLNYFPADWFPHLKRLVLKTSTTLKNKNFAAPLTEAAK
ncbi:hypothetical protein FRC17_001848, partial [Serendipita sp. 399]